MTIKCRVSTEAERPEPSGEAEDMQQYLSMFPGSEVEE